MNLDVEDRTVSSRPSPAGFRLSEDTLDRVYRRATEPLAHFLSQYDWVTPNRVSFAGFLVGGVGAAVCILTLPFWTAGLLLAFGDMMDYLDGDLARKRGAGSRQGAILDSVLDRYMDLLIIGTLTYFLVVATDRYPDFLIATSLTSGIVLFLALAALSGTMLTPYIRARTEAEGRPSVATIGDRGWRNRILIVGLVAGQPVWAVGLIAVVANVAAIRRLIHALGER